MSLSAEQTCVFLDLDGTLLNSQNQITEHSIRILQRAKQCGVRIVISTARSGRLHGLDVDQIKSFCSTMILQNGAEIWLDGERIYAEYLLPEEVRQIATLLGGRQSMIAAISEDGYYTNYDAERYWGKIKGLVKTDFMDVENPLPKLMIYNPERKPLPNNEMLEKLYCVTVMDGGKTITISRKTATKGNAIRYLQKLWNVSEKSFMAIGNDRNDLSAFEACAVKVAVANADAETKAHCTQITGTNDENGAAEFIAAYLNL